MTSPIQEFKRMVTDGGPIYKETDLSRFPVEPFNTFSNIVFLLIIIYFAVKVYKQPRKQYFLATTIPILFLGFVGGTIYHASRSHAAWLYLDWVPIVLLCMAAAIYFIFKLDKSLYSQIGIVVLVVAISIGVRRLPVPPSYMESVGYLATAGALLLPIVWYIISTKGRHAGWIVAALVSFMLAIFFRMFDRFVETEVLYMGTHWLWHLFGGISVFFLMSYIYRDAASDEELKTAT